MPGGVCVPGGHACPGGRVCPGGMCAQGACVPRGHVCPGGMHAQGGMHGGACKATPQVDTTRYGHPTGMHSLDNCFH